MARFSNPFVQYFDGNGDPLIGAKLFFYEPGTTTPKNTYSDSGLSTPNANPVVANGTTAIFGDIFLDGVYAVELKDANGVTIDTADPVGDTVGGQFELWLNDNTYNIPDLVAGSDDNYYKSIIDSNQGNDPTTVPTAWEQVKFTGVWNTNATYATNDLAQGSDGFVYRSLIDDNTGNDPISDAVNWGVTVNQTLLSINASQIVGGGFLNIQVITATGTFAPTAGATKFHIFATGAGAGSGGANAADADSEAIGGAGGAGGTAEAFYNLTELGANAAVSIGAGGAGGAAGANDGSAGGATTFTPAGTGAVLTGNGGAQGLGVSTTTFSEGGAGAGGTATGGAINRSGGSGHPGNGGGDNVKFLLSGPGGASYWGQGGNSQNLTGAGTTDGAAGVNYGSGASGGLEINSTAAAGAAGADGVVIVYEYA